MRVASTTDPKHISFVIWLKINGSGRYTWKIFDVPRRFRKVRDERSSLIRDKERQHSSCIGGVSCVLDSRHRVQSSSVSVGHTWKRCDCLRHLKRVGVELLSLIRDQGRRPSFRIGVDPYVLDSRLGGHSSGMHASAAVNAGLRTYNPSVRA